MNIESLFIKKRTKIKIRISKYKIRSRKKNIELQFHVPVNEWPLFKGEDEINEESIFLKPISSHGRKYHHLGYDFVVLRRITISFELA